jgi:SagB-type dehydrogenase family enzyme
MSRNRETDHAFDYHDLTKHSYISVRSTPHFLDWENKPSPFKLYPELEPVALPRDMPRTGMTAFEAITPDATEATTSATLDLDRLASILYFSAGVTKHKSYPGGEIYFRAAACAGALYPVETYVAAGGIEGLKEGVYHFNPGDFSLRQLREGDQRGAILEATADNDFVRLAPVVLIYTAITWRSSWKYRARSYRYHFWDNGMIAANAVALCRAHGLSSQLVMGFEEEGINRLVGIDGERELSLSLLTLGSDEAAKVSRPAPLEMRELDHKTIPLSKREVDYPQILMMHRASSFDDREEVKAWRNAAAADEETGEAKGKTIPLSSVPPESLPDTSIEEVILRRASTRRFAHKAISFDHLSTLLDRATRGFDADFLQPPGVQLNEIYLIANRIDGLDPGAYYYRRKEKSLELIKSGDFSKQAAYLTLDQPLGGDASATIFFMADLKSVLGRLGNRGYRAVQMEAGVIGGKMYLGAYALGRGATGLTFYDDDVTEFFSPHAAGKSCIFVTSIGVPGKRPIF